MMHGQVEDRITPSTQVSLCRKNNEVSSDFVNNVSWAMEVQLSRYLVLLSVNSLRPCDAYMRQ